MRNLVAASPSLTTTAHAPRFFALILLILAPGWIPGTAVARCIPFDPGDVTSAGGQVLLMPDGTGPSLEDLGATITVQLWACPGEPNAVVGLPAQDVWLEAPSVSTLAFCAPGAIADAPTDATGTTTIARALAGGGSGGAGLLLHGGGTIFPVDGLQFVSPDLNGDLDVDLVDVAIFAIDFHSGDPVGVAARSDFDFDGRLDLSDLATMAAAIGKACP